MAAERKTIYVDDATGRQIASPEEATTGGASIYRDGDADRWLSANPDNALKETPEKAQKPAATKERAKGEDKGA